MMTLEEICLAIQEAERKAGELILHAKGVMTETKSGARDVVTQYDRAVQQLVIWNLRAALPEAHFFCEEMNEQESLDAAQLFIIDPIDGTMNFVRGFSHSCVSVAYAENGVVQAAAIYNPYLDEMFHAVRGAGAFLNGSPIRTAADELANSVVCFGTAPYNPELSDKTFALARRMFDRSLDVRREGTAALDLASVAAGRAGLYFELSLSLWDFAAGALIVEEAGGVCRRADGEALCFSAEKSSIVAAASERVLEDYLREAAELR